jgi:hypothetical protein
MKEYKLAFLFLLSLFLFKNETLLGQITVDNSAPYNTVLYLVDSLLLGEGVTATGQSGSGDPNQIGFFNGINSNIGLDSGIIMSSGNIEEVVPGNNGAGSINIRF